MAWIIIIALAVAVGVLFWLFRELDKILKDLEF